MADKTFFVNFSTCHAEKWAEKDLATARGMANSCEEEGIINIPFPTFDTAEANDEAINTIAEHYVHIIERCTPVVVGFIGNDDVKIKMAVAMKLKNKGIKCVEMLRQEEGFKFVNI